jgi:hypothetical protein
MGLDSDRVVDWTLYRWALSDPQRFWRIPIEHFESPSGVDRQAHLYATVERLNAVMVPCLGPSLSLSLSLSLLGRSCLLSDLDEVHDNQMQTCPPCEHLFLRLWTDH